MYLIPSIAIAFFYLIFVKKQSDFLYTVHLYLKHMNKVDGNSESD